MRYGDRTIQTSKLLKALGLEGRPSGANLYIKCPLHQDSSPSFSLHLEKGVWICFSKCGAGTLDNLVERMMGMNSLEAHQWLLEMSESNAHYLEGLLREEPFADSDRPVEILERDSLREGICPDWFRDRGFDEHDISTWGILYESSTDSLILPIGKEGFCRRYPPSALPRRYYYSSGLVRSKELFGCERILRSSNKLGTILVTEGALDTIWAVKHGFESVAILGSFLSEYQFSLISKLNPEEVCLALDNDKSGHEAAIRAEALVKNRLRLSYFPIPQGVKDLNEMTKDQLQNSFQHRYPVTVAKLHGIGPWEKK